MKILYITQTFPPEPGPTLRPFEQAVCLQNLGHKLTVLTTMPYFPMGRIMTGYKGKLIIRQNFEGVDLIRIWSVPAPNKGFFRRVISQLSFAAAASIAGLFLGRYDLVIASVPNMGTELAAIFAGRCMRSTVVLELRDVIPDNLVIVGVDEKSFITRFLRAYFKVIYRLVDLIVVPSKSMAAAVSRSGPTSDRILVLPHAADPKKLFPGTRQQTRCRLNLEDKFVVLYAGSFRHYYGVPNLVQGVWLLQDILPQVRLLLLGTGPDRSIVEDMINQRRQSNVILLSPVTPKEIGIYLQAADLFIASVVSRNIPQAYYDYLTTKVCEYLMIGKPVIAVEDAVMLGDFLKRIGAGFAVQADRPQALAEGIEFFATNPDQSARSGSRAAEYANTYLQRETVVAQFEMQLVQKVCNM